MSLEQAIAANTAAIHALIAALGARSESEASITAIASHDTEPATIIEPAAIEPAPTAAAEPAPAKPEKKPRAAKPAAEKAEKVTIDDVRKALTTAAEAKGREKVKAWLEEQFTTASVAALEESTYPKILAGLEAL